LLDAATFLQDIDDSSLLSHSNEDVAILSTCVFTNLAIEPTASVRAYVFEGPALNVILRLVESANDYMQHRALWSLSCLDTDSQHDVIKQIVPVLLKLLRHAKKKEVLQMVLLVLTNLASCGMPYRSVPCQ
jgi:hypothetical protein